MKQVGIVRRIDELGRIVVPKEIRRYLKIDSGDFVEINLYEERIILSKFHPLNHNQELISNLCEALKESYQTDIIITNSAMVLYSTLGEALIDCSLETEFIKRISSYLEKEISALNKISLTDNYVIDKDFICYEIMVDNKSFGYLILLDKIISKKQKDLALFLLDYLNRMLKD